MSMTTIQDFKLSIAQEHWPDTPD